MSDLSGKTPTPETSANVYSNEGFSSDDVAGNTKHPTDNNSTTNNLNKAASGSAGAAGGGGSGLSGSNNGGFHASGGGGGSSGDGGSGSGGGGGAVTLRKNNTTPNLNNTVTGKEAADASGEALPPYDSHTSANKKQEDDNNAYYSAAKKDSGVSGSVEFSLPTRGRERSKSLLSEEPYRGMGKEELLRFSSRPLWRNLRYACMSIVLTGWLALLITVVALVLTYPHCRKAQSKDWWQKTVVYRIYVRSFLDSKNDVVGIGDINGIFNKLEYLKETGVGTISLSPIYKLSPHAPSDTHIVNHTEIDPVFGTMQDFERLVNKTHALGMHLMLDFVPNHTSNEHPWFVASKDNSNPRENMYRSYYVWQKGVGSNNLIPPNSWQSVYGCPAWDYHQNHYYLHQFMASQPELNLRSEKVRNELENILLFWLDLGVDGFYIRDADYLFEDYDIRDDFLHDNSTKITNCQTQGTIQTIYPYHAYNHTYTKGVTEVFDVLARWRAFLDDYGNKTNKYKMLIADVDADYDHVMHYYGLFNRDGVDFPLNKFSLKLGQQSNGHQVADVVYNWLSLMPAGRWANWMGGDDRSERLTDRLGPQVAMPYLIMTMLLPGTPYLYYGDEIGMRRSAVNVSNTFPGSRERAMRGPMLWNTMPHAGFCSQYCKEPWIAPYVGFNTSENINVEAQKRDPFSMWHLFKNLTQLRKDNPSFEYGDYVKSLHDDKVFSFVREFDGEKGFLVALNFGDQKVKRQFTGTHNTIPSGGTIEVVSGRTSRRRGHGIGLDPLTLEPYQGVVVSWDYVAEEI